MGCTVLSVYAIIERKVVFMKIKKAPTPFPKSPRPARMLSHETLEMREKSRPVPASSARFAYLAYFAVNSPVFGLGQQYILDKRVSDTRFCLYLQGFRDFKMWSS
jgi:hypothetical protein